jgi:DNA polymerase III epsilon subunit-like protein
MKLNPKYRYIWLDFETTGLDPTKDEPIQIGIVEIDSTGNIKESFSSLIQPTKDIDQIKTIVWFITGITIEDIIKAPTKEEILAKISHFFDENTVIIWHNIQFDLKFLNKFFPSLRLSKRNWYISTSTSIVTLQIKLCIRSTVPGENAHDALQDTKNALILFQQIIEKCEILTEKFPILQKFNKQERFFLSKYKETNQYWSIDPKLIIRNIPKLNKILGANTQPQIHKESIETKNLENQKRYFIGNIPLKTFLERIIPNKNIILSFSNLQKLNITKSMLNSMGLKTYDFSKMTK